MNNLIKAAQDVLHRYDSAMEQDAYDHLAIPIELLRLALAECDGTCIVPIEPTEEMCRALVSGALTKQPMKDIWKAMLSAYNPDKMVGDE